MGEVTNSVTFVAHPTVIGELVVEGKTKPDPARISEPAPVTAGAFSLDAPLNPADVEAVLAMITVIAKTVTALSGMVASVLVVMRKHKEYKLVAQDPKTGKVRGVITHETPEEKVKEVLGG